MSVPNAKQINIVLNKVLESLAQSVNFGGLDGISLIGSLSLTMWC